MSFKSLFIACFMGSVLATVFTGLLVFNSNLHSGSNAPKTEREMPQRQEEEAIIQLKSRNKTKLAMKTNMKSQGILGSLRDISVTSELEKLQAENKCLPEKNILFLKTHKTGSSTITNILNRFADLNELTVAIPVDGDFRFAWPSLFHWTTVDMLRLDGEPANILCNHARYNRAEMEIIMQNNTKYITILRNPVLQFESAFYYFEYDQSLAIDHLPNPLEEFLRDPDQHLYNLTMRKGDLPEAMNLIQSGMFYDLGLDFMDFVDKANVQNTIRRLDREFDLVMIMDYFDESLVLMKRKFCWDFDDVLYIKMNQRRYQRKNITEAMAEKIKEWNKADTLLYEYFNETFWEEIRKQGRAFWDDLREFRARNRYMERKCSPKEVVSKGFGIDVEVRNRVMNPTVERYHRYFCQKMLTSETDYLSYFRKKLGYNYGYQRLLIKEGLKSTNRPGELRRRLLKRRKRAAFLNIKKALASETKLTGNGKTNTTRQSNATSMVVEAKKLRK